MLLHILVLFLTPQTSSIIILLVNVSLDIPVYLPLSLLIIPSFVPDFHLGSLSFNLNASFEVPLLEVDSLQMLSFYLFEHGFILYHCYWEDLNSEYRLLDGHLFFISLLKILSSWLLASHVTVYKSVTSLKSFLFSLAAFIIFPLSLIFCSFIISHLSMHLFLSILGFIEIPEYVDLFLSSRKFSTNTDSSTMTSPNFSLLTF